MRPAHRCLVLGVLLLLRYATSYHIDKPCAARHINNQSVVCVCTENYCDTITRMEPEEGQYYAYTSSKGGLRFHRSSGRLDVNTGDIPTSFTLDLDPVCQYQVVKGFGGAVTDSAAVNWKSLRSWKLRQHLIDSYFSVRGIEYNMMRLPIGGTDFSVRGYTYNDLPEHDNTLSNFTLAWEDTEYKIPLVRAAFNVSTDYIHIVGSTWTPPAWMKNHHTLTGISRLKKEYYNLYALYHLKFLEEYDKAGIPIWGLTTTNEPLNGVMSLGRLNRLGWTVRDMGKWIAYDFGPMIKNSEKFKDTQIIAGDDQRFTIPMWFNLLVLEVKDALKYIDGVAFHYYFNKLMPPTVLTETMKDYPDKFLLSTEACEGVLDNNGDKVLLGSWKRAENYASDILENLNYNVTGWIDWNMCLNETGGPTWVENQVDSPVIINADKQEFYKQPMFYALGHFSKFIPRGSRRVQVTESCNDNCIEYSAFITPRDTIAVILLNKGDPQGVTIRVGAQQAQVLVEAQSIVTVELNIC